MKKTHQYLISLLFFLILMTFISPLRTFAQNDPTQVQDSKEKLECRVIEVVSEEKVKINETETITQELKCEIRSGDKRGEIVTINTGEYVPGNTETYGKGDLLQISTYQNPEGETVYVVIDYVRKYGIITLFIIFLALAVIVGKKEGFFSLIAMAFTFLIVMKFMLPQLLQGRNPVLIVVVSSIVIIPITFFLSHGFNKETIIAITSTLISLLFTGILAQIFIGRAYLQGISSEEAAFLDVLNNTDYDLRGLLLGGIIISVLGVLDDITIAQSDIVFQLNEAEPKLHFVKLYKKAMRFGKNHIASMINTLVLVYAGASIPLLLMFMYSQHSLGEILNIEIIASEIVNMLIGSIGLILAVPITTFIACFVAKSNESKLDKLK